MILVLGWLEGKYCLSCLLLLTDEINLLLFVWTCFLDEKESGKTNFQVSIKTDRSQLFRSYRIFLLLLLLVSVCFRKVDKHPFLGKQTETESKKREPRRDRHSKQIYQFWATFFFFFDHRPCSKWNVINLFKTLGSTGCASENVLKCNFSIIIISFWQLFGTIRKPCLSTFRIILSFLDSTRTLRVMSWELKLPQNSLCPFLPRSSWTHFTWPALLF